jgi:hypothetical protein
VSCLDKRCSKSSELAILTLPLFVVPVRRTVALAVAVAGVAVVAEFARLVLDDDEVERRPGGPPEAECECKCGCDCRPR